MILRSGVDLVEINRLAAVNPAIRQRFLRRVFTPAELAYCKDSNERLSGRFGVKEAASKVLGTGIGFVHWQDIETLRGPAGEPQLVLHGNAEKVAAALGLTQWSVSITHSGPYALAFVVALGEKEG